MKVISAYHDLALSVYTIKHGNKTLRAVVPWVGRAMVNGLPAGEDVLAAVREFRKKESKEWQERYP